MREQADARQSCPQLLPAFRVGPRRRCLRAEPFEHRADGSAAATAQPNNNTANTWSSTAT